MKYDLIFSMGEACSCSELIRLNNYQDFSYPFDWVAGLTFLERAKILANDFKDFINKEDLVKLEEKNNLENCFIYRNKTNNIYFYHDFYDNVDFDEMYIKVKEKYDRRINRLINNIKKSKNILIIYLETPIKNHDKIEDSDILAGYNIIKNKYPNKNIKLIYFTNSKEEKTINITKNITRYYFYYKFDEAKEDFIPNFKLLTRKIIKDGYRFKMTFGRRLQIFFAKSIPFKAVRKHFKKKYHVGM